jgi:hypothetical protein
MNGIDYGDESAVAVSKKLERERSGLEALQEAYWDAADDGKEEDLFFRRCVSEGRIEDLVRLNILEADEAEVLRFNHPDRDEALTDEQKETLLAWIEKNLEPAEEEHGTAEYAHELSSYGMKSFFETSPEGFYIDNGQMKVAMLAAGYEPSSVGSGLTFNWAFKVRRAGEKTKMLAAEVETELTAFANRDISVDRFLDAMGRLGVTDKHGYVWVPIWGARSGGGDV